MDREPIIVLLAEDDDGHSELVRRSIKDSELSVTLMRATDGQEALDYLYRRNGFSDPESSPRPGVILLDLRMPRVDGLKVLESIRADADFNSIPVVVLTTSDSELDIAKAYDCRANSYLVKPSDFVNFDGLIKTLGYYWLQWNQSRNLAQTVK